MVFHAWRCTIDFVQWQTNRFAGDRRGCLESRLSFKVKLVRYSALQSTGESARTASLNGVNRVEDVEGRDSADSGGDNAIR